MRSAGAKALVTEQQRKGDEGNKEKIIIRSPCCLHDTTVRAIGHGYRKVARLLANNCYLPGLAALTTILVIDSESVVVVAYGAGETIN